VREGAIGLESRVRAIFISLYPISALPAPIWRFAFLDFSLRFATLAL
jgi:hypothetical protein